MTMMAWTSKNIRRSPPIRIRVHEDDAAGDETEAGCDIHETLQRTNGRDPVARAGTLARPGLRTL